MLLRCITRWHNTLIQETRSPNAAIGYDNLDEFSRQIAARKHSYACAIKSRNRRENITPIYIPI